MIRLAVGGLYRERDLVCWIICDAWDVAGAMVVFLFYCSRLQKTSSHRLNDVP